MRMYKIAEVNPIHQAYGMVLRQIERGDRYKSGTGRITRDHINISFYAAVGSAHIQVFFDESSNTIGVHKYYDNEMINDEYRAEKSIAIDVSNPSSTAATINTIINHWMGGIKK